MELLAAKNCIPATLIESHKVFLAAGTFDVTCAANTEFKFSDTIPFSTKNSITSNYISPNFLKTFTLINGIGLSIAVGLKLKVTYASDPDNTWMVGNVYSYVPSTGVLKVLMTSVSGSGTYTNWTISQYYDEPWCSTNNVQFHGVAVSGSLKLRATSLDIGGIVHSSLAVGSDIYSWDVETYAAPFKSVYGVESGVEVESELFSITSQDLYYNVSSNNTDCWVSANAGEYQKNGDTYHNATAISFRVKAVAQLTPGETTRVILKTGSTTDCLDAWYTFDVFTAQDLIHHGVNLP